MVNARTGREVGQLNDFERRRKIKTSIAKFKVIPLATRNPAPLIVDGNAVPFDAHGSILGLNVTRNGYASHIRGRA